LSTIATIFISSCVILTSKRNIFEIFSCSFISSRSVCFYYLRGPAIVLGGTALSPVYSKKDFFCQISSNYDIWVVPTTQLETFIIVVVQKTHWSGNRKIFFPECKQDSCTDHGLNSRNQGDQVGRILAYILGDCLLRKYFEKSEVARIISGSIFFRGKSYICINFDKKAGYHFGRFFHKLIWSPCPKLR
jgi:hypothetical protein